jgi:HEAT repeat protein
MAACVLSGDSSALTLFRQFATTLSFELVQLSVLGSGAARDTKAVEVLTRAMDAPSISVRRAACMALVSVGTNEALEIVAHTLLNGDEDIRRAAAEALANDPHEGYAMLRDGITLSDILLRRSVVYGLGRVKEPWAAEILQKVQVEDDQWVVRNAATEILDASARTGTNAPRKLKAPSESPWLVEFAAKQGMGISPGTPATEVLLRAFKSEDVNIRLAALPYLKYTPSEGVLAEMYSAMYAEDIELREAVFNVLWELGAAGVKLPQPAQYGYN